MIKPLAWNPWNNPNPEAIRRVTAPLVPPNSCPYCQSPVELVNNSVIYGRPCGPWPYAYCCVSCNASVSVHPETAIPAGTLADRKTASARRAAKGVFNRIWQDRHMSRTAAYHWLGQKLGIKDWRRDCHIGLFDAKTCDKVQKVCATYLTAPRGKNSKGNQNGTP